MNNNTKTFKENRDRKDRLSAHLKGEQKRRRAIIGISDLMETILRWLIIAGLFYIAISVLGGMTDGQTPAQTLLRLFGEFVAAGRTSHH